MQKRMHRRSGVSSAPASTVGSGLPRGDVVLGCSVIVPFSHIFVAYTSKMTALP